MSLKPFHIVLISSAMALGIGLGFWAIERFTVSHKVADLLLAAGSFVTGLALAAYLGWFLRKMKEKGW